MMDSVEVSEHKTWDYEGLLRKGAAASINVFCKGALMFTFSFALLFQNK